MATTNCDNKNAKLTARDICTLLDLEIPENCNSVADDILTNISYSDKFIREGGAYFVNGKSVDDINYKISKAIENNVKILFITDKFDGYKNLNKIPHVMCKNIFKCVIKVSAEIRERKGMTVVGITGSLGKTTTKDIVYEVLRQKYVTERSLGNQNTIFPMLDNLQKYDPEFYIQEFGAATPNVMPNTVKACLPNAGIITNISDPHLDVFKTKENIMKEKVRMLKLMPKGCPAFLNYDDELLQTVKLIRPIISYAVNNKNADYYVENIKEHNTHMTFDIVSKNRTTEVKLNAHGIYNISNAVVAYAVGEYFGLTEEEIVRGIESFTPGGIRQNLTNIGGYNLYIDCYNNAPISLVGAVDVLSKLEVEGKGRKIAVISDIDRLGDAAASKHREVGEAISEKEIDMAICFGNENAAIMAEAIGKSDIETYYFSDRDELDAWLKTNLTTEDIVLIKGAVIRLLSRTIDHVFGTSLQLNTETHENVKVGDYKAKVIWEKEHVDKKTVMLIKYTGSSQEPDVPEATHGGDVFSIGPGCFKNNKTIKNVIIPESVTNIAKAAFRGCSNLKNVQLPSGLKLIEDDAFRECWNLKEIVIPEGVIGIGERAFLGCTSLKRVVIPATVGKIDKKAFVDCKKVKFEFAGDTEKFRDACKADEGINKTVIKRRMKRMIKKIIKK